MVNDTQRQKEQALRNFSRWLSWSNKMLLTGRRVDHRHLEKLTGEKQHGQHRTVL